MTEKLTRRHIISRQHGRLRLSWVVEGPLGALEFHYALPRRGETDEDVDIYPGVEKHARVAKYPDDEPIQHCWVLGGPCYPNGSSLLGIEWRQWVEFDPDRIFDELERLYPEWFREEALLGVTPRQ